MLATTYQATSAETKAEKTGPKVFYSFKKTTVRIFLLAANEIKSSRKKRTKNDLNKHTEQLLLH